MLEQLVQGLLPELVLVPGLLLVLVPVPRLLLVPVPRVAERVVFHAGAP